MTEKHLNHPTTLKEVQEFSVYTIKEISPLLKLRPRTLRKYCLDGIFENAVNIGGKTWLIPGYDILHIFNSLKSAME